MRWNREDRHGRVSAPGTGAGEKRRGVRLACLGAGLTLLAGVAGAQDTLDSPRPATHPSQGYLHVEVSDDLVTVKARDAPVKRLLEEIAGQSGLLVDLQGPLDERATMEFDRLPLPIALGWILRGQNFVLRYVDPSSGAAGAGASRASRLWVFPSGPGDNRARTGNGADRGTHADLEDAGTPEDTGAPERDDSQVRLSPALADDEAKVRLGAISELAGFGGDRAAAALAAAALSDEDSSVREEAVHGLGENGDEAGMKILEQALRDPDPGVREAAVEAVADIGGNDSARVLAFVLNDEDASLREEAVYALGEIGGENAIRILQQALADQQDFVREAAAEVLAELSSRGP